MEANVRNKILYLIQAWAHAFRNEPKYKVVQDTYQIMKVEGESWGRDTASRSWGAALPQVGPQEAVFSLCGRGQRLTVTSCGLVEWVSPRWVLGSEHPSLCLSGPHSPVGQGRGGAADNKVGS